MNNVNNVFAFIAIALFGAFLIPVQAAEESNKQGYISDDLFIYMHAGPGTNYKILGTIIAGTDIKITGVEEAGYSEIIDDKSRVTWVESKYVTTQAGLRFVVDELNSKISTKNNYANQLDGEVNDLTNQVTLLVKEKEQLATKLKDLTETLAVTRTKIKDQDTNIKKQWFFTGAMVLGVGLFLGLILPRFFSRRRGSMDSWS